jgi:hypothetical protein
MMAVSAFVRSERLPPPSVFVPVRPSRGRPKESYKVKVESERDALEANRAGVPLFALTSKLVGALGYPLRFPDQLVVANSIRSAVDTPLRCIEFVSEAAASKPRVEDVAIAFLSVDPVVGRVLLERNRAEVRPDYLLKRVLTENVEQLATWARFSDLSPSIPKVGNALPLANLEREFRKNQPGSAVP